MKFLKEAIEQTSRRLRFQEWILLALRCLAISPAGAGAGAAGTQERRDRRSRRGRGCGARLRHLLQHGRPRRRQDPPRSRKDAALAVLETLPTNSSVQIYSCSDRAGVWAARRFNLDQARQLISGLEVTSLSTDLLPGLTEAFAAAKSGTAPAKEIYVFSDMQKSGFERQQGALKAKCEEIKPRPTSSSSAAATPSGRPPTSPCST